MFSVAFALTSVYSRISQRQQPLAQRGQALQEDFSVPVQNRSGVNDPIKIQGRLYVTIATKSGGTNTMLTGGNQGTRSFSCASLGDSCSLEKAKSSAIHSAPGRPSFRG